MMKRLCVASVVAALSSAAYAAPIDSRHSTVSAIGKQMGVAVTGQFGKITGDVHFNPAKLAQAKASIEIDIASYDMGLPAYNKNILGADWFNAAKYPKAVFKSTAIQGTGNKYTVSGKFYLKGKVQNIAFPVTFKQVKGTQIFDGAFIVKRTAFDVGAGDWADTSLVADDVTVRFHLVVPTK